MTDPRWMGRLAYALAFAAALPAALVLWARALEPQFDLPAYRSAWGGGLLAALGALIWMAGVVEIVRRGDGLPMNAFPPARLVTSGIYALVAHPIYLGWVLACAGLSSALGSAAGLWIVTPLVALGCAALVFGLERPDLRRRFGDAAARFKPWLSLPRDDASPPALGERLAFWFTVLAPWLLAYDAVKALGVPPDAIDVRLDAEKTWAVWLWTVPIYISAYAVVPLAAFLVPTRAGLRRLAVQGLTATAVITVVYLAVPFVAPFRPFDATGPLGRILALDQRYASPPMAAWPAFHAVWAAFIAEALAARSRAWGLAAWTWAGAIAVSCVTTGMHAVADLPAAAVFYLLLRRPFAVWRAGLDAAERLANSWRAWRVGPLRIISHGVYAGAAAGVGLLGMGALAGTAALPGFLTVAAAVLLGAGLWAQWVEGSSSLLRPFGYYGAILGGAVGTLIAAWTGQPAALVLGATAAMAPWIHAIGRLRCLAQGCCHGGVVDPRFGIRVWNEHSRVLALAHLAGRSIHATQVYSIVGNVVMGVLLLRLWQLLAPLWFITGAYLILAGLARFVEEAYRGEPQTKRWLGLPMYQHLAVGSVLVGAVVTSMGGPPAPPPATPFDPALLTAALATGVVYWFAMGVDFPESRRRFARLSG